MPYLDSNVFLYSVLYSTELQPKAKKAQEILASIANGLMPACTSTLTWDEVVWIVKRNMGRAESVNQGKKLLGFPNLEFIAVDDLIVSRAQKLMEKYKSSATTQSLM
jgi:predicted nucleic acid-binding protein